MKKAQTKVIHFECDYEGGTDYFDVEVDGKTIAVATKTWGGYEANSPADAEFFKMNEDKIVKEIKLFEITPDDVYFAMKN